MKLTEIRIFNFRSIKSEIIQLDHNCLILLGKNEAGKSNILKAIAAVFGQYIVSNKDKRKRIDNEEIEEYYIRAIIELDENDFLEIQKRFILEYTGHYKVKFKNEKLLLDFIKDVFKSILIKINISDNKEPEIAYWQYSKKDFLLDNILHLNGKQINTDGVGSEFNLIYSLFTIIKAFYKDKPYGCLYWNYDNNYLLPSNIAIDDFISTPEKFKALENLFILCKRENIKKEFETALQQDGDYENLLDQISKKTTSTFRNIWSDFRDTSIQLRPNGDEISIKVANKAKYAFDDRSDGFKKFISILLMISTQARSNTIGERDIILIDEPDQSLYPTSARLLRDELLKISEKSTVIYSTHSQYMIDSNCIERHLIVEKKEDITTTKKEDRNAPFSNDELLRQAIGSSIFECLNEKNIIFEGWLDKELFNKYCKLNKLDNEFKNIGIVYLGGISGVESLVQLLILANKKFVIVADSDEASNNKKIEFCKNYKEYTKSWLSYSDVISGISTMEDFIIQEHILKNIQKVEPTYVYDTSKNSIQNIELSIKKDKTEKQKIKNSTIEHIDKKHIKEEYGQYIVNLKELITSL